MNVGSKIFSVAAVLVAGTTAVALFSLDRISRVNREVVTVATYHAPLARILAMSKSRRATRSLRSTRCSPGLPARSGMAIIRPRRWSAWPQAAARSTTP